MKMTSLTSRAFVAGTAVIGSALFVYSIKVLGWANMQATFVRISWGSRRNSPAVRHRTSRQNGGLYVDR